MPRPRKTLISPSITDTYHCTTRCVQGAFLCGFDTSSGKDFEHRRHWIADRIIQLTKSFSIGVCAYAVMHNHYHIVLKIDNGTASKIDAKQVIERWLKIYPNSHGAHIAKQFLAGEHAKEPGIIVQQIVSRWRKRLSDVSWFMRALNENIARRANAESGQSGHFWQSRFNSQALLDDAAIIGCMAYVDLNPIRAKIAKTLEQSDYTSVKQRIKALKKARYRQSGRKKNRAQPANLVPFGKNSGSNISIPFSLADYLHLLEISGRAERPDKRGNISSTEIHIFEKLDIDARDWYKFSDEFENNFSYFVSNKSS